MTRFQPRYFSLLIGLSLFVPAMFIGCASQHTGDTATTNLAASDAAPSQTAAPAVADDVPTTSGQALFRLQTGNDRFVTGKATKPNQDIARRTALAGDQHPFAVILGCSDSRVPPEVVFDCGLGDLFVVRVAGNVCSDSALASIEYATEHLGATLVVVLGHDQCGAVKAAIDADRAGVRPEGHLYAITHSMEAAVKQATTQPGNLLDTVIDDNVQQVVRKLENSEPIMAELVHSGKVRIVGARYHLESGRVTFYPADPTDAHN